MTPSVDSHHLSIRPAPENMTEFSLMIVKLEMFQKYQPKLPKKFVTVVDFTERHHSPFSLPTEVWYNNKLPSLGLFTLQLSSRSFVFALNFLLMHHSLSSLLPEVQTSLRNNTNLSTCSQQHVLPAKLPPDVYFSSNLPTETPLTLQLAS